MRSWRDEREIPKFLLAYYLINDAMVTVLYFTAIFLKATFGLGMQEILVLSLVFQVVAIPSTIFFGWLGDRWSQFGALLVTLVIWIAVLALMGLAEGDNAPPAIAITLGLVLGSTQSLLRSMYSVSYTHLICSRRISSSSGITTRTPGPTRFSTIGAARSCVLSSSP